MICFKRKELGCFIHQRMNLALGVRAPALGFGTSLRAHHTGLLGLNPAIHVQVARLQTPCRHKLGGAEMRLFSVVPQGSMKCMCIWSFFWGAFLILATCMDPRIH